MVFIGSNYIRQFIEKNTVDLMYRHKDSIKRKLRTPTLGMYEFYQYLEHLGDLFSQEQYYDHLLSEWRRWVDQLTPEQQFDVKVRAYRNFYLSGVDQIYVQALLAETGIFQKIYYDHRAETSGVDIFATTLMSRTYRLELHVDTGSANRLHTCKDGEISLMKKLSGKKVGGMYFYKQAELDPIIKIAKLDQEEYEIFWKPELPCHAA
jgi:hypothetical protein